MLVFFNNKFLTAKVLLLLYSDRVQEKHKFTVQKYLFHPSFVRHVYTDVQPAGDCLAGDTGRWLFTFRKRMESDCQVGFLRRHGARGSPLNNSRA